MYYYMFIYNHAPSLPLWHANCPYHQIRLYQGDGAMELITNWQAFNSVSLAFCQFQGMLWLIAVSGIVI